MLSTGSQHSRRAFKNVCDKLKQMGSLSVYKSERRKRVTNEENEIGVLANVATNPHISSRQIEREPSISRSVFRILHRHEFHPYHVSLHQKLQGNDFMNRIEFCRWANGMLICITCIYGQRKSHIGCGRLNTRDNGL
ncbi:hypothetical protein WN55_04832 [Dufourea novaeangliae]|uniref:Uncharacterized protein n=1 Tax=Dufourea novaeangliae TaxID=178035 RepID=A0A154NZK2_DUFNO|nr:hypothetical protein WN55_04832 [Dufourea novaeangliae]